MTSTSLSSAPHRLGEVLRRVSVPLLIFAAVLAGLLTLSWVLLVPRYTSFVVDGKPVAAEKLADIEREIERTIAADLARREEMSLPSRDATYLRLLRERFARRTPLDEEVALRVLAGELGLGDAMAFTRIHMAEDGLLTVEGDLRGVGPRSMTELARFVDTLALQPDIVDFTPPAFVREEDPAGGFHSPFIMTYGRTGDTLPPPAPTDGDSLPQP